MMNDIYLEYILKKKKTGGQKAIIAVIIFEIGRASCRERVYKLV